MRTIFLIITFLFLASESWAIKLDPSLIRPWNSSLVSEFPRGHATLAIYKKGPFELLYLAAHHSSEMKSDTLQLVHLLFQNFNFNVLLIEPYPFSLGVSPKWFLKEAAEGKTDDFIKGGEASLGALLANERSVPFFGGEPSYKDVYKGLRGHGFNDIDILGFVLARQIPEWVRDREAKEGLIQRLGPRFIEGNCKDFGISKCPNLDDLRTWYEKESGHKLTPEISNEEFAPFGDLLTQKIAAKLNISRNHFTLNIIESLLNKYRKVAVIYGAGHFVELRKVFDSVFGEPKFINIE